MKIYMATRAFTLGDVSLKRGDTIQYDGTQVTLDGVVKSVPAVRTVIRNGWLVEASTDVGMDELPVCPPVHAQIKCTSAKGGNPFTAPNRVGRQSLSLETTEDHRVVLSTVAPRVVSPVTNPRQSVSRTGSDLNSVPVDSTTGKVVSGTFQNAAKPGPVSVTDRDLVGSLISQTTNAIAAGPCVPRDQLSPETVAALDARLSPEERTRLREEKLAGLQS